LKRLAAQANETHAAAIEDHKRALRLSKLKADAGEKQARKALEKNPAADVSALLNAEEPEAPALRRFMANDTSPAALGELLRQNPNGLLVFRDELVSLLRGLDREDQAEGRGFYLTGWNGDSGYTFDRITRGMNLHIPAVCLSLLGSTQPGRLAEYVRHAVKGGAADDGLIQRFGLLVWPNTGGEWKDVDRWPDGDAKREAHRVFDYLDKLDPAEVGAEQETDHNGEPDGLPFLRFDAEGLGLFLEWRTGLETRLRGGELHPAMESHLAKYRKLIPGLALILHLAEGGSGPISERSTLQALAWGEYLESHARRAYGSVSQTETAAAKAVLERIRKGDLPGEFPARDIYRNGWAQLSDLEQVADALRLLIDYDWLREIKRTDTGGKPATLYQVNPRGAR
jgi:putative DNA primase/helicase